MIQRIQSVYLLITFLLGAASYFLPVFSYGTVAVQPGDEVYMELATYQFILPLVAGVLGLVAIFLYKNRKLQLRLCTLMVIILLFSVVLNGVIFIQSSPGVIEDIEPGIAIPVVMLIFAFLAKSSITKDEKLVKSLDRLR